MAQQLRPMASLTHPALIILHSVIVFQENALPRVSPFPSYRDERMQATLNSDSRWRPVSRCRRTRSSSLSGPFLRLGSEIQPRDHAKRNQAILVEAKLLPKRVLYSWHILCLLCLQNKTFHVDQTLAHLVVKDDPENCDNPDYDIRALLDAR